MSSSYHVLCLNHDPALVIDIDSNSPVTAAEVINNIRERPAETAWPEHAVCHLMIGRYSYPLIELGCMSGKEHGHADPWWIRTEYLYLLQFAYDNGGIDRLGHLAVMKSVFLKCFTPDVLYKIREELNR